MCLIQMEVIWGQTFAHRQSGNEFILEEIFEI